MMLPCTPAKLAFQSFQRIALNSTALAEVEDLLTRSLRCLTLEVGEEVVAIEVNLERSAVGLVALHEFLFDVGHTRRYEQSWHPVFLREYLVAKRTRLNHARPPDDHRYAEPTLPSSSLLAMERCDPTIRPGCSLRPIICAVDHDRVLSNTEVVELL